MKHLIILAFIIGTLFPARGAAQQLVPVDNESSIRFSIKNFGFSTNGSFKGITGKISFDAANLSRSAFDVSISAGTIETGNNTRDRHLRSDAYFDVEHFPQIFIKSETITSGKQIGSYILHGVLTMKGASRKIDLPFTVKPAASGYIFEGEFTINRLDYKVGSNSVSLSDDATVFLKVSAR
ncbi:YceI family protein [Flavihumibacter fluvii]|uniref:YceI family protein n=1 Tax=Flavihumibacter fluvii TaxID=2838157 RepID=UPI001BDEB3B3|nr:YceI family protein [Flavihumibacter fluvii]ULQ54371.1 YceI family protein [Flavihumibacter fluvii]